MKDYLYKVYPSVMFVFACSLLLSILGGSYYYGAYPENWGVISQVWFYVSFAGFSIWSGGVIVFLYSSY